jgi:WD40 repeat protein
VPASCPECDAGSTFDDLGPDSQDDGVAEAVLSYQKAVEAGRRPDRAEFLRRHADLAEQLEPLLSGGEHADSLLSPLQALATTDESAADLPAKIGRYRLEGQITVSGMARIVRVRDQDFERPLAMKIPLARGDEVEMRFVREARITGALQHPGIPPVHSWGRLNDGRPYFVMKLIQGSNLCELLKERTSPAEDLPRFIGIFEQICQTVGYAHACGVIHRDLKPANVMVGKFGEVQVLDWGLAKVLDTAVTEFLHVHLDQYAGTPATLCDPAATDDSTRAGRIMGTWPYISPEAARGMAVDERSDVFGLGGILCEILTGQPPFTGSDAPSKARSANLAEAEARLASTGADPELVQLARSCLTPSKAERPEDGAAVAAAVAAYQAELKRRLWQAEIDRAAADARAEKEEKLRKSEQARADEEGRRRQAEQNRADEERRRREAEVAKAEAERKRRKTSYALAGVTPIAAALLLAVTVLSICFAAFYANAAERAASDAQDICDQKTALEKETERAKSENENRRRINYDLLIQLAHHAWHDGDTSRTTQLLKQCDSETDLRGWECGYLKGLCHKDVCTLHVNDTLECVAFSPNGRWLAAAGPNRSGEIHVWSADGSKRHLVFKGHTDWVFGLAFRPDSNLLASCGKDGTIRLWDMVEEKEFSHWSVPTVPWCRDIAYSPDGNNIAVCDSRGFVTLWNSSTGKQVDSFGAFNGFAMSISFHPEKEWLAVGGQGGAVTIWDLSKRKPIQPLVGHTRQVSSVAFSPNGRVIATGSEDQTVKLWDPYTGELLRTLTGHAGWAYRVFFSPNNRLVGSCADDGTVRLWDVESGEAIRFLRGHTRNLVRGGAFHPNGRWLGSAGYDGQVKIWDMLAGSQEYRSLQAKGEPVVQSIFSADGKWLAWASRDRSNNIKVMATATGKIRTFMGHKDEAWGVAFHPTRPLMATGSLDRTILIWDLETGKTLHTLRGHVGGVRKVSFSPDGQRLASASDDKTIKLWDWENQDEAVATLHGHEAMVTAVAVSPVDGNVLASASNDKTVRLWNLADRKEIKALQGHTDTVYRVSFSPDGRHVVSGGRDHSIMMWEATTGKLVHDIRGAHMSGVLDVVFSPDGRRLASASNDRTVRIWDASNGQELLSLKGHPSIVYSVAFSPDGRSLVSAGAGAVYLWEQPSPEAETSRTGLPSLVTDDR